jgi:hypothetical protein
VLVCVATLARAAASVSRALLAALLAELGVFGTTVCWGIAFELVGVALDAGVLDAGVAAFDAGVALDSGVVADGVAEDLADGGGADGGGEVVG